MFLFLFVKFLKSNPEKSIGAENVNVHSIVSVACVTTLLMVMVTWGVDQVKQLKDVYTEGANSLRANENWSGFPAYGLMIVHTVAATKYLVGIGVKVILKVVALTEEWTMAKSVPVLIDALVQLKPRK